MEKKKSNKANLEKLKSLFFIIGIGMVFGFLNIAFNYDSKTDKNPITMSEPVSETTIVPVTRPPDKKPEPPKDQKKKIISDILTIVPSDEKIDTTEYYIPEFEDDDSTLYNIIEDVPEETIFNPSIKPKFPGGISALQKYIAVHTKYPEPAQQNDIEGTVFIQFQITKTGKVGIVNVLNKNSDELLQKEAVRVIKTLPKFKPGIQNGKPVNVWYSIPVSFKLY